MYPHLPFQMFTYIDIDCQLLSQPMELPSFYCPGLPVVESLEYLWPENFNFIFILKKINLILDLGL